MDSSLQSANLTADEINRPAVPDQVEVEGVEEEQHHIHLPNPSLWPFILSVAILLVIAGMVALPDIPWLSIIAAPFVLVGILGWALEDPMASPKVQYISVPVHSRSQYTIGQEVVDKNGEWLGTVQARFDNYILVDRGGLVIKPYYVPSSLISSGAESGDIRLAVSEVDLLNRGLDTIPDDLYNETLDADLSRVTGVPLFARGPLSPAETGHYNYGPNYPGINTDASGSYQRDYVVPAPSKYVGERRKVAVRKKTLPARS